MSGILVVIEDRAGGIARISWEALAAGQQLAAQLRLPVSAADIGAETKSLATEVAAHPLAKVVCVEHPLLAHYTADGFTLALEQLIRAESPAYIVFPHTYQVRDYAPALAARFGQSLIGDVVAIDDGPVFMRQLMQGRLNGIYRHTGNGPCFLSVQAGAFRAESVAEQLDSGSRSSHGTASVAPCSYQGMTSVVPKMPLNEDGALAPEETASSLTAVSIFTPTLDPDRIRTRPGEPFRGGTQTVDLGSAQRIVSVGRGIKDAANIPLVQELATALGAELAASRPICDSGWLPIERQVGSSGHTVSPKLYLAVGISGAIQHLVGMKGSQCVVAINKDSDAPIFEVADYGIVGDLFEVVPALIAAVKAAKR